MFLLTQTQNEEIFRPNTESGFPWRKLYNFVNLEVSYTQKQGVDLCGCIFSL